MANVIIQNKCTTTIPLNKGQFIDVKNEGTTLIFTVNTQEIDRVEAGKAIHSFNYRNTLKAVVKDIDKNGAITVEILRWADLNRHSGYSLLNATSKIKDMVEKTEYVGALTDDGVMFGSVEYYKAMKAKGKKPIIGFEAYTESIDGEKNGHRLVLLAMNETGFKNLVKLTSLGYENVHEKPLLSYDLLRKHAEGVVALSGSLMGGEIPNHLLKEDYEGAKKIASTLSAIFGSDNFYLEVQRHGLDSEDFVNNKLVQLAFELELKIVGTTNSFYTNSEDEEAHEIVLCMRDGKKMEDEDRPTLSGEGYHIHTADEVEELFEDFPTALANTLEIAEKCTFEMELGNVYLPHFDVPKSFDSESAYFEHLCWQGFEKRYKGTKKFNSEEYKERLQFEIDTINGMGFPGYFLIVWDFVDFAKRQGILVGPGRGSACGSLVAYALEITEVDPIQYGLLFERFLNPERISMPDIDLDFDDTRREEVIDYVKERYGAHAVSRIITFGTLAAKSVVRDVARVKGFKPFMGDRIAKTIPSVPKMTLTKAFKESVEFTKLYNNDPDVKEIVDMGLKLEGLQKNISQHACGVIIAPSAVTNYLPQLLIEDEKTGLKEPTTQITMSECEELGLLKMDFLGLRTMGVVSRALGDINPKRVKEGKEPIDFLGIPTNDVHVYDFISKGNTEGVFQLESGGMTSFMKELFQDVHAYLSKKNTDLSKVGEQLYERAIAGISLYRPGPIDEIPNYINNMLNPDYIQYELPALEPILKNTYGIIVYQEQVMFIVRELAGFSKGQADTIRKAMGKKKNEILDEYETYFVFGNPAMNIKGCVPNGIPEDVAKRIWAKMKKFGEYAFNKSHAGGYAEIAIRTGWLSCYYPSEYMTATLNSFLTKADKIKMYMSVCKKKGIEVLPPDVNKSKAVFTVDGEAIRFGLMGIKNMGKISKDVINERDIRGMFSSFQDFAERMATHYKVNKGMIEALVYSGALDSFEGTRKAKLAMLSKILDSATIEKKNHLTGQVDIFSVYTEFKPFKTVETPVVEEFEKKLKLDKEKHYAGFYVTEHPLDEYMEHFEREGVYEIGFLKHDKEDELVDGEEKTATVSNNGETVKIAGIVKDLQIYYTKKDQKPLYVFQLEDTTGEMKAVVFENQIQMNQDKLVEGKIVIVQGDLKEDDFGTQVIVKNMLDIEALVLSEKPKSIWVKAWRQEQFDDVTKVTTEFPGELPVFIQFEGKSYKANGGIELNLVTFSKLQEEFGEFVKVFYEK